MFEQTKSEKRNPRNTTLSAREYNELRNIAMASEESNKKAALRQKELHDRIGNDRDAIMEGSNDRVNGLEYSNPYPKGTDKYKSYAYGYNEHGQRRINNMQNQTSTPKHR